MDVILPPDCELLTGEFADREKFWSYYCHVKKVDWAVTTAFLLKLRNEDLSDLHEILHAPVLKTDVGKQQLHFDINLLTSDAVQKDFDARKELAHLLGLVSFTSVMAADHAVVTKFVSDGEASSRLAKFTSALAALPISFDSLIKNAMVRFFDARSSLRQMAFRGYEQNIRVLELQRSSPFCPLLFPEEIVRETLDAIRLSPMGIGSFFKKNRNASQSSNWPFKSPGRAKPTPKTKKSPAKKPVVFHPGWSKSSQASKGGTSTESKGHYRPKSPFRGKKGGPYKGKGRGASK